MNKLIPFVSTHFRVISQDLEGFTFRDLTLGKVYRIIRWEKPLRSGNLFTFLDDVGDSRTWTPSPGLQDVSFHVNLEKILE